VPRILLAGENLRALERMYRGLQQDGLEVRMVHGLAAAVAAWVEQRQPVVLLDVPDLAAVEPAIDAAVAIKRRDRDQFVGYLAEESFPTGGLTGDAIFPRSAQQLPVQLRAYFATGGRRGASRN